MQLKRDSCACGHLLDQHDGGRGAPCNECGCSAGEAPTGFEAGVIHSLHELTASLMLLLKEMKSGK